MGEIDRLPDDIGIALAVRRASQAERGVYDWNAASDRPRLLRPGVTFLDETLRDGIQNPSVNDPSLDEKLAFVRLLARMRVSLVNLGLPASSTRNFDHVVAGARVIVSEKLPIGAAAAGRTVVADMVPIVEIAMRTGLPIEAYTFVGSSPIRQLVEAWDVALIARRSAEAIDFAVKNGLAVSYVTEDTTRTAPAVLRTLFTNAIDHGAHGICLADTVGHACPDGVRALVAFTRDVIDHTGVEGVRIDWHGHNDRGLALPNAMWALEAGVDRVHGTALGIGERVGNVPMEMLLMNLRMLGEIEGPSSPLLAEYVALAARALGWRVPEGHPFALAS